MLKTCQKCGKAFEPQTANQKFCSHECYHKYRLMQKLRHQKTLRQIECLWCRKQFKTEFPKQKFCCRDCSGRFRTFQKKISRLCEFQPDKTTECMKIFEENGLNSNFPYPEVQQAIEQARTYEPIYKRLQGEK